MNGLEDRMNGFETRLDGLKAEVGELRSEVRELRGEVRQLRGEIGELRIEVRTLSARVDTIGDDVSRLKILYEDHTDQIRKIAEVLVHHGERLEEHGRLLMEVREAILPLKDLRELVPLMAKDHERRIARLDTHTGLH